MQTFVPLVNIHRKSFGRTAICLDDKRLNKQILEARQIINLLEGVTVRGTYINHPAVVMWRGHTNALKHYFDTMLFEWLGRGKHHSYPFYSVLMDDVVLPPWLGYDHLEVVMSHRAMLYKKDPVHYKNLRMPGNLWEFDDYVWPSDLYQTYYHIQTDYEFEFGQPEDVLIAQEDRFATREDCIAVIEKRLLNYYNEFAVDGNSRFTWDDPVQLEPLCIRMQPVRFIDYNTPLDNRP